MMMCYLGLGVGHLHPVGFPTEIEALKFTREENYPIDGAALLSSGELEDGDNEDSEDEMDDEDHEEVLIEYEY